ncbi:MAG: hypothetical protein HRU40_17525, partial [Saprospiraceae bacterium]|nr:hypothetical protein [Saprospiraceae bacterium]
ESLSNFGVQGLSGFNSNVYAATPDGLEISNDNGASFPLLRTTSDGLPTKNIQEVFVSSTTPSTIFAVTVDGIARSIDNGTSFTNATVFGLPIRDVYAENTNVFVATSSGLFKSTDTGASFMLVPLTSETGNSVVSYTDNASSTTIFYGTDNGLMISSDGGNTFTTVSIADGLPSPIINDITVTSEGIILVATALGIAWSTDGGYSFDSAVSGLTNPIVQHITEHEGMIFISTTDGLAVTNLGVLEYAGMPHNVFIQYDVRDGIGDNLITGIHVSGTSSSRKVALGTLRGVSHFTLTTTDLGTTSPTFIPHNFDTARCAFQAVITEIVDFTPGISSTDPVTCTATTNLARLAEIAPPITASEGSAITTCEGVDGEIILSGMLPNLDYKLDYYREDAMPIIAALPASGDTVTTDSMGRITVRLVSADSFVFTITTLPEDGSMGCSSAPDTIVLMDPDPPVAPLAPVSTTEYCAGSGLFTIELPQNPVSGTVYQWYTDDMGTAANPPTSASATYQPNSSPATSGSFYVVAYDGTTRCTSDSTEVPYEINQAPVISIDKTQPTTVGGTGEIEITITNYDGSTDYTLNYEDASGTPQVENYMAGVLSSGVITLTNLSQGVYKNISVSANGCTSAVIPTCPIAFIEVEPDDLTNQIPQTVSSIVGGNAGYFQDSDNPSACAGASTSLDVPVDDTGLAIGRIRDPQQPTSSNPAANIELRGYVQFDLNALGIPANAVIERVEYQPVSIVTSSRVICGPETATTGVTLRSATGDIQFDVTQVRDENYGPYTLIGYSSDAYDDLGNEKYNDFTISAPAEGEMMQTGAWTDLGAEGVSDVQRRLADDGVFQVGLTLSGSDFDIPVLQFHGMVFAPGSFHNLRISYHVRDYGDHPEGKYLTDLSGGYEGPSHRIDYVDNDPDPTNENFVPAMFIGMTEPDGELMAVFSSDAEGDDNGGTDDEDLGQGNFVNPLTDNILIAGNTIDLEIPYVNNLPGTATIYAFVDWDDDGVFNNTNERYTIGADSASVADDSTAIISMDIPATATTGEKAVRVRISSESVLDAYGQAVNGEVEDFFTDVIAYDYADLPDTSASTNTSDYHTLFANNGTRGPRHLIVDGLSIGTAIDAEGDGQPQANAFGDDVNGIDDEDGITPPDSIIRGQQAVFEVIVINDSGTDAFLQGFADWNDDGSFEDGFSDQKSDLVTIPSGQSGPFDVTFNVPQTPNPLPERVAVRFRLSNESVLVTFSTGPSSMTDIQGEVQDMYVNIVGYDWGDLPEPLYITDARGGQPGPSHKITSVISAMDTVAALYIGATVPDAEVQGQPDATAMGDDNNTEDDEDLTVDNFVNPSSGLPTPIISGEPIRLVIPYTNNLTVPANIYAFIDWNADGDFLDDEELTILEVPATTVNGTANLDFVVPQVPTADSIGVRIRITSIDNIDAYGQAPDGEVEDLFVERRGSEYGDLPDVTASNGPNDFNTYNQNNGPRHGVQVTPLTYLGALVDTDADGQPTEDGNGDDLDTPQMDDEDGVIFLTPLVPGYDGQLSLTAVNDSASAAKVFIYTDWENDGTLDSVTSVSVAGNSSITNEVVTFSVPTRASFQDGNSYWRFRITTDTAFIGSASADGLATDGEVEDYFVPVFKVGNLVWED